MTAMFVRRACIVVELAAAALCLWAAAFHTPLGALVRTGGDLSLRPLLAYYGDHYEAAEPIPPLRVEALPPTSSDALGAGVEAVWRQLSPARRQALLSEVARELGDRSDLDPSSAARALSGKLGSEEAALLALFCGPDVARYALSRSWAVSGESDLEALARQLPPGFEEGVGLAAQAARLALVYRLSWPVAESALVSSRFGMRRHPIFGLPRMHTGVDLAVPEGTEVRAAEAGVVRRAGVDPVNGWVVVIDHGRGVRTGYAHNARLLVSAGQRVSRGMLVAHSGNTGRSTGPHLHYQLELGGRPVDPLSFRRQAPSALDGARIDFGRRMAAVLKPASPLAAPANLVGAGPPAGSSTLE